MKEESIRKINKMGHAGQIIANICKVLLIIAAICVLAGACGLLWLPEGAVTVSPRGGMDITVDAGAMGLSLSDQQRQELLAGGPLEGLTLNGEGFAAVEVEGDVIRFLGQTGIEGVDLHRAGYVLLLFLLYPIALIVTMFFVASLCKALRYCQTPFCEDIVTRIRRVAWSLIPWALLNVGRSPVEFFNDGKINFTWGVNLETVLLILIIFALAFIFRYGAMLQQESDETL